MLVGAVGFFVFKSQKPSTNLQTDNQTQTQSPTTKTLPGYNGQVIAGTTAPYLVFNQSDFEKAKSEGKIILLNFYANWCPICRAEAPVITSGFDAMQASNIVGFRVNFNDSETDDNEKSLAKEFNVPFQHTKIFLKNGQEVSRSGEQWAEEDFEKAVSGVQQ